MKTINKHKKYDLPKTNKEVDELVRQVKEDEKHLDFSKLKKVLPDKNK